MSLARIVARTIVGAESCGRATLSGVRCAVPLTVIHTRKFVHEVRSERKKIQDRRSDEEMVNEFVATFNKGEE